MRKIRPLLLIVLLAVSCSPELQPPTKDPNYNTPPTRIFVRIVTGHQSYDTMTDAMARMKSILLERGHEFAGGIIARERYRIDAGPVEQKLAGFRPDAVLEIAPAGAGVNWAPTGQTNTTGSIGRYYHAVLFQAADKRPVWSMEVFRPLDIGNLASRRICDGILRQLEADGLIRKK